MMHVVCKIPNGLWYNVQVNCSGSNHNDPTLDDLKKAAADILQVVYIV